MGDIFSLYLAIWPLRRANQDFWGPFSCLSGVGWGAALLVAIGVDADGLLAADGHLAQVVVRAVVDVQVYVALDARQPAVVGVLPEFPRAFVRHAVYVVVGYPVRVAVEGGIAQMFQFELVVSVEYGLHAVVCLGLLQPLQHAGAELLFADALWLLLHVEHRWQVAPLQFDVADEESGLVGSGRLCAEEMVGSASEAVLACLCEIVVEALVHLCGSLSGLYHHEADGALVDGATLAQFGPVDVALIVADVNAVYVVAFGVVDVAVECSPAQSVG